MRCRARLRERATEIHFRSTPSSGALAGAVFCVGPPLLEALGLTGGYFGDPASSESVLGALLRGLLQATLQLEALLEATRGAGGGAGEQVQCTKAPEEPEELEEPAKLAMLSRAVSALCHSEALEPAMMAGLVVPGFSCSWHQVHLQCLLRSFRAARALKLTR